MKIFITGITGTIGTGLAPQNRQMGIDVSGCARNEAQIVQWVSANGWDQAKVIPTDAMNVPFYTDPPDVLIHAAALKHVDVCERFPAEAVRQNVTLTEAVADACQAVGTRMYLLSTDKAVTPGSKTYGATKYLAEQITIERGQSIIRLGNVIASSGSVFEKWDKEFALKGHITVTDPDCTRFFMTLDHVIETVLACIKIPRPGTRFPSDLKAIRMGDVAIRLAGSNIKVTGLRPGETLHQYLIPPVSSRKDPDWACSSTADRWEVEDLCRAAGVIE